MAENQIERGSEESSVARRCAFCLEALNEGANTCKSCGRKQPLTKDAKSNLYAAIAVGIFLMVILGGIAMVALRDIHQNTIDQIVSCAMTRGQYGMTHEFVESVLDDEVKNGESWDDATHTMLVDHGCSPD